MELKRLNLSSDRSLKKPSYKKRRSTASFFIDKTSSHRHNEKQVRKVDTLHPSSP